MRQNDRKSLPKNVNNSKRMDNLKLQTILEDSFENEPEQTPLTFVKGNLGEPDLISPPGKNNNCFLEAIILASTNVIGTE